ncbi:hypothetical protein LAUMK35_02441 [Mycobacterium pseudokansasii]|nr:hypothetical protein LAUMK35_02441 [Mycobacterium pseudokansasii]VAZ94840.1 hypothetical protein LAUMK21_02442 [Mycobacterium pseudokansasii]
MAAEDGPTHWSPVSWEITDWQMRAVVPNSSARSFHAAAAPISGPDPAQVYMRVELISGGNAAKPKTICALLSVGRVC